MESKIIFFGDGELYIYEPLIYFKERGVVCNFSECGSYVAGKQALKEKPIIVTLNEIINSVDHNSKVEAWNNGIARFFERNNIKTIGDLAKYFNSN
jgi:hypothetical protein